MLLSSTETAPAEPPLHINFFPFFFHLLITHQQPGRKSAAGSGGAQGRAGQIKVPSLREHCSPKRPDNKTSGRDQITGQVARKVEPQTRLSTESKIKGREQSEKAQPSLPSTLEMKPAA